MAKYRVVKETAAEGTEVFVVEVKHWFTWKAVNIGTCYYWREVYTSEHKAREAIEAHILKDSPPKREVL